MQLLFPIYCFSFFWTGCGLPTAILQSWESSYQISFIPIQSYLPFWTQSSSFSYLFSILHVLVHRKWWLWIQTFPFPYYSPQEWHLCSQRQSIRKKTTVNITNTWWPYLNKFIHTAFFKTLYCCVNFSTRETSPTFKYHWDIE